MHAGRIEGPRVVASGPWLGITGGTCDFNGTGIRGADAFRSRVREDVERGADLIKVCVTGWLADAIADPMRYEITDEELSAAIDEAHRRGRRVAVHALSQAGISAAVTRGADLVVHAGFPSPQTVALMKERGVAPSALRAATLSAARAVGMSDDIGVLSPGRLADVIGVEGNPLEDLRTLQHVSFVMKEGTVFKGSSAAPRYFH